MEFSGPSGARGEIHVCRTTTKRVDWRKRVRNQYVYIRNSALPHRNMCASPRVVVRAAQFRGLCPVRSPSALVGRGLWHALMGWPRIRAIRGLAVQQIFSCTGRPRSAPFGSSNVVRRKLNNWLFYYFYMVVGLWVLVKSWLSYERNTLLSLIGRWLSRVTNLALGGSTEEFFFCVFTNLCKPLYTYVKFVITFEGATILPII